METGSPAILLQQYLAVMTKGSCDVAEDEFFDINNFAPKKAFLSASIKGRECFVTVESFSHQFAKGCF